MKKRGEKIKKRSKKGISYVEIMLAFTIFLIGLSVVLYFFLPFFKPEYRTALSVLEKKFNEKFMQEVDISKLVLNQSVTCAQLPSSISFSPNTIIYSSSTFEPVPYSTDRLEANGEQEFYVYEFEDLVSYQTTSCSSPILVEASLTPEVKEKFISQNKLSGISNYNDIREGLLPGFNLDFNITIIFDSQRISIGKPLAKTNIFSSERFYRILDTNTNQIKIAKVRFYVW